MQNIIELAAQVSPRRADELEEALRRQQNVLVSGFEYLNASRYPEAREEHIVQMRRQMQAASEEVDDILRAIQRDIAGE